MREDLMSANGLAQDCGYSIADTLKLPQSCINPLRAKFLRENINIYLHFMSFLHINRTQVVEIPPSVRQGPAYSI